MAARRATASHAKADGFSKWRQVGPGIHVETDGFSKWRGGSMFTIFGIFGGSIFEACSITKKMPSFITFPFPATSGTFEAQKPYFAQAANLRR